MALPTENERKEVGTSMNTLPTPTTVERHNVNDMYVCTYNESHVVSGGRYASHIRNCQKMYGDQRVGDLPGPSGSLVTCPFDFSHRIHSSVFVKHLQLCDGYYKYHMEHQEEPPSMREEYPRYDEEFKRIQMEYKEEKERDSDSTSNVSSVYNANDFDDEAPVALPLEACTSVDKVAKYLATQFPNATSPKKEPAKEATKAPAPLWGGIGRGRGIRRNQN